MVRATGGDGGSRRARLLVLLGLAAAFLLVQAQASHAAVAVSGGAAAEASAESGAAALMCRGAEGGAGPCMYVSLVVHGSGRLASSPGSSGERVACPAHSIGGQTWECTLPLEYNQGWFNWSFGQDPVITLTPTPEGASEFQGYQGTCPNQVNNNCVLDANELGDLNYIVCVEAFFSANPGTKHGECVDDPGDPPFGDPINVTKAGSGTGTVTSEPNGMNCGRVCNAVFPPGQQVTLHSNADTASGSVLSSWTGPCTNPQPSAACVISMPMGEPPRPDVNVTATYSLTGPPPPPPPPPPRPALDTRLFKKPPKTTKNRTATFAWGATRNGSPFFNFKSQCRLNKQAWKACTAPRTYRKLKPGRVHTVRIRVGYKTKPFQWDPTPAVWKWRIRK